MTEWLTLSLSPRINTLKPGHKRSPVLFERKKLNPIYQIHLSISHFCPSLFTERIKSINGNKNNKKWPWPFSGASPFTLREFYQIILTFFFLKKKKLFLCKERPDRCVSTQGKHRAVIKIAAYQHDLLVGVVIKPEINSDSDNERLLQIFYPHVIISTKRFSGLADFLL